MKLNDLLEILQDIKEDYGNIDVCINDREPILQVTLESRTNGHYIQFTSRRGRTIMLIIEGKYIGSKTYYST